MDGLDALRRKYATVTRPRPKTTPAAGKRDYIATKYMQKAPIIMPNYGKKKDKLGVPKTSVSRVLLYDNITQQQMLDVKLAHIKIERDRMERLMNLHKKSFYTQLVKKREKAHVVLPPFQHSKVSLPPPVNRDATNISGRQYSIVSFRDLNLPDIGTYNKQIVLKLKTKSGKRKMYHSYDENGIFVDCIPLYSFYPSVKDDPRFYSLESALITPEEEEGTSKGFAMLSPSYPKQTPRIPTFLKDPSERAYLPK